MSTVRLRRLQADYQKLRDFLRQQPRIRLIQAEGNPPERYQLEYQIKSLRQVDEQLQMIGSHTVEISLPLSYPRMPPQCRMLTPIFHPNIAPHAICIGDHWSPGEPLCSMVTRIGEMIAYQSYNIKSPLNGEAARWVEQNIERLPLDRVSLFVDASQQPAPVAANPPLTMPASTPPVAKLVTEEKKPLPAAVAASTPPVAKIVIDDRKPLKPAIAKPTLHVAKLVVEEKKPPEPVFATPPPARLQKPAAPAPPPAAAPAAESTLSVDCPGCNTRYRVPAEALGKRVRCKKCQSLIVIPPGDGNP